MAVHVSACGLQKTISGVTLGHFLLFLFEMGALSLEPHLVV